MGGCRVAAEIRRNWSAPSDILVLTYKVASPAKDGGTKENRAMEGAFRLVQTKAAN